MSVVLFEKKDNIGIITLNRPEKLNALNSEIIKGLREYISSAGEDPEVKVIVLRSAGTRAFTAGFDLKENSEQNIVGVVERRADTQKELDLFMNMWYLPKPIICAIQGYSIGGGTYLAMVSDLIIAADNASFGNPATLLGYIPEMLLDIYKLPLNKVTEWLFLSKYFSVQEMYDFGFVNEIVPLEKLEERTLEVAHLVARIPTASITMMKQTIRKCYDFRALPQIVDYCAEMFNLNRIRMQQDEAISFREDVNQGGLSAALKNRYN